MQDQPDNPAHFAPVELHARTLPSPFDCPWLDNPAVKPVLYLGIPPHFVDPFAYPQADEPIIVTPTLPE